MRRDICTIDYQLDYAGTIQQALSNAIAQKALLGVGTFRQAWHGKIVPAWPVASHHLQLSSPKEEQPSPASKPPSIPKRREAVIKSDSWHSL
jgi:hypothetical protein